MNLGTIRAAVQTRLGVPATDSYHTTAKLNQSINAALQYIAQLDDWAWLEKSETIATINGTQSYATAVDAMRTIDVLDATGLPLAKHDIDDLDYLGGALSANPRWYAQINNTLLLFPTPNTVQSMKHRYVALEPYLAADSDTPLMYVPYHEAIVDRATYLAELGAGNDSQAAASKASFDEWVATMQARASRHAVTKGGGIDPPPPPPAPVRAGP